MLMLRLPRTLEQIVSGPVSAAGRVAAFVLLLLLPGVSGWAQSATPRPVASASAMPADWDVFAKKGCATCHRVRGMGDGAGGSDLGRIRSGTGFFEIAAAMWNHGPTLRADLTTPGIRVPRLTGQEMADITAYLHASFYFDRVQGDGPRGERRVQDKGCLRCHSIYNKGGRLAPDFATSNVVSSQVGQVSAMWNHGRQIKNLAKRRPVVLPTLTAQELSDITRYLAGLGGGAPVGPPRPK
jgi:mono/diheme cytochrome c family protein